MEVFLNNTYPKTDVNNSERDSGNKVVDPCTVSLAESLGKSSHASDVPVDPERLESSTGIGG